MVNTNAYYKLTAIRNEIEENIEEHKEIIVAKREEAKKFPKGSIERKHLMTEVQNLGKDIEYQHNMDKLKLMNICINTVFYGCK